MNISGQHRHVVDAPFLKHVEEPGASVGVTIPLVRVQNGGFAVASELAQHHLLAKNPPTYAVALGALELIVQPCFLGGAKEASLRILDHRVILGVGCFPVPAIETGIQHGEIEQIPEAEAAPNSGVPRALRFPSGQPLVPRFHRCPFPRGPGPFPLVMILRAIPPAVVGGLMVIPDHYQGMLSVQFLQICICSIESIAFSIIGKGSDLPIWRVAPPKVGPVAIFAVAILIDVVAKMEHKVEVVAPRHSTVGVEVAEEPVGTGGVGNAQVIDARARKGAGPAQGGRFPGSKEAIIVGAPGVQAVDNNFHGVVASAMGAHLAAPKRSLTLRVGIKGPAYGKGCAVLLWCGAGPEYDAVLAGIPGGDAVKKDRAAGLG